jgi:putative flippase GtrA
VRPDAAPPAPALSPVVAVFAALYARFRHLTHELGKFGLVGAISYLVDFGVFNAIRLSTGEPFTAKIISTVVAATTAFLGNRFWTWRHARRTTLARQYSLYFLFNLVGLGIGLACLLVSHNWLGAIWPAFTSAVADNISANLVGVGLATMFRFWAYRRFVFPTGTDLA